MKKNIIIAAIAFALGFLLHLAIGNRQPHSQSVSVKTIRDTVHEYCPLPYETRILDSILVPVPVLTPADTVFMPSDTVFVYLDREQKYYKGKNYEAWVSGYQPQLDRINVFNDTKVITKNTYYNHQISLFANPIYAGTLYAPIGLRYQYSKKRWDLGVSAGYDPIHRSPVFSADVRFNMFRW